jgi:hypothetical protein
MFKHCRLQMANGKLQIGRGRVPICNLQFAICNLQWILGLVLFATPVHACNVPVFRYALERWELHPYEVTIVHSGPLSEKHKQLVAWLQNYGDKDAPGVGDSAKDPRVSNIEIRTFDLMSTTVMWADPIQAALLSTLPVPDNEPHMIVSYPPAGSVLQATGRAWNAPFTPENAKALLVSPARHEICRRIVGGQSAVWVFIDCGDKKKDDAAYAVLDKELAHLQKTMQLPVLTDTPKDKLIINTKLQIEFSIIRLSRDSVVEAPLVHMLMNMERELWDLSEPAAFPVFGKGIGLPGLSGKGIKSIEIEKCTSFIIGACGCESRKMNPGTDLLMTMDWEGVLKGNQMLPPEVSPLLGLSGFSESSAPKTPGGTYVCGNSGSDWLDRLLSSRLLLAAGAGFVIIILVSYFFRVRQ